MFNDVKHLADGGFSSVYTATWIDGPKYINYNRIRSRLRNRVVVLKVPNNVANDDWSGNNNNNNVPAEFLNEVRVINQ